MANLWQFFGLPDPDGPEKNSKKKDNPVTPETRPEPIIDEPIPKKSHKAPEKPGRWQGPTTPDGEMFHDLGDKALKNRGPETTVQRGLRYIVPDDRHRLPLEGMESRLNQGDVLIVDLRNLVHMDAHQNACRRLLRELADAHGFGVSEVKAVRIDGERVSSSRIRELLKKGNNKQKLDLPPPFNEVKQKA